MEHCSGTPGVLDLPTLGAFLAIAAETHQPELPAPLDLIVANVTKWRPDILKWFQHTKGDVFLMQETKQNRPKLSCMQQAFTPSGAAPRPLILLKVG